LSIIYFSNDIDFRTHWTVKGCRVPHVFILFSNPGGWPVFGRPGYKAFGLQESERFDHLLYSAVQSSYTPVLHHAKTGFYMDNMKLRTLNKNDVAKEPDRIWNAYVDILATEKYEILSPIQRPAFLVFRYESEVQNGGHFQFFANQGTEYVVETVDALRQLGAICQMDILREANELFVSKPRQEIETIDEFCKNALEGEFSSLDTRFYACSPSLQECLESYLNKHISSFVLIA